MSSDFDGETLALVERCVVDELTERLQTSRPSAAELIERVEDELGLKARWDLQAAIERVVANRAYSADLRAYLGDLVETGELHTALAGKTERDRAVQSGIDELLRESQAYLHSEAFQELVRFMARFREYSPYNNLLVKTQKPACEFFATARHWRESFRRRLIEDARPLVILQPRGPVLLVYDLDQTEGPPLPEELETFATFEGTYDSEWLDRIVENAGRHYGIRIDFKPLSSTLAGFATTRRRVNDCKMRIAIHDGLDAASQFGVVCHELAHILLGHLGNDADRWWPSRYALDKQSIEVEAEATAWIVISRLGLTGSSPQYVSRYLRGGQVPAGVSVDHIGRVAGKLLEMATRSLPTRELGAPGRRAAGRGME